ncbi:MAG TPA: ATP-binding cassette domain-containing protein [Bacillota bacterium]|nr:ATP-binding cassette domain-containing protein [Bacillota bacterium]
MEKLKLHQIVVQTKEKTILQVDEISFPTRNIFGIVGPSGAGKSTLLRVMNLLIKPSQGTIDFFGKNIDLPSLSYLKAIPIQRQMAYVPQKSVMFDTNVYENVAIGLRFHGIPKQEIDRRVRVALEQVGLIDYADRKATTLSGGESQRIALARSLVLRPKLLLLDEPTSNLDPINVSIFEQVIYNIYQQTEMTVIMVTHNLLQAKRLASQCLFIHQGQLLEMADTESFFEQPQTKELAAFLSGQMIY